MNMKKNLTLAACALLLAVSTGCAKKSKPKKLPAVCENAVTAYAKLNAEQKDKLNFATQLGLNPVLEDGKGNAEAAVKAWKANFTRQYNAVKQQDKQDAERLVNETEQQCSQWLNEIEVFAK